MIFALINIPNTRPFFGVKRFEVIFMFKDKSHDKINNDRAAECEKRQVNKIHPYGGGFNAEFFSPPLANAKRALLEPLRYFIDHVQR